MAPHTVPRTYLHKINQIRIRRSVRLLQSSFCARSKMAKTFLFKKKKKFKITISQKSIRSSVVLFTKFQIESSGTTALRDREIFLSVFSSHKQQLVVSSQLSTKFLKCAGNFRLNLHTRLYVLTRSIVRPPVSERFG